MGGQVSAPPLPRRDATCFSSLGVGGWACSCMMWLVRSITPIDRLRFVRNHLRRGVRYDARFRAARLDDDIEPDDADDDATPDADHATGMHARNQSISLLIYIHLYSP